MSGRRLRIDIFERKLVLDQHGGPNHGGNFCSAPVLADLAQGRLLHQSSYASIGHFARFIQPGARRVLCAATLQALEATACLNPDGTRAVVMMNRTSQALAFTLHLHGATYAAQLPPRAMASVLAAAQRVPGNPL